MLLAYALLYIFTKMIDYQRAQKDDQLNYHTTHRVKKTYFIYLKIFVQHEFFSIETTERHNLSVYNILCTMNYYW